MKDTHEDDIITIEHVVQDRQDLIDFTVYVADAIDPKWLDSAMMYIGGGERSGKTIVAQAFFHAFDGLNRFLSDQNPRDIPFDEKFYLESKPDDAKSIGVSIDTSINGSAYTLIYQSGRSFENYDEEHLRNNHVADKPWNKIVSIVTGLDILSKKSEGSQPLLYMDVGNRIFDPDGPRKITLKFKKSDLGSCPRFMSYMDALTDTPDYQQPDPNVWRGADTLDI